MAVSGMEYHCSCCDVDVRADEDHVCGIKNEKSYKINNLDNKSEKSDAKCDKENSSSDTVVLDMVIIIIICVLACWILNKYFL